MKQMMKVFALVALVALVATGAIAGDDDRPIFLDWMDLEVPLDRAITTYWQLNQADRLDIVGQIDLGTMLAERGYPNDAVEVYKEVLEQDKTLVEVWHRLGMVHHSQGEEHRARKAYNKCLDLLKGHGWCNFQLGRLEESSGRPAVAAEHFAMAFRVAPELSDPIVNPLILESRLALGGELREYERRKQQRSAVVYMNPGAVAAARGEPIPVERSIAAAEVTESVTAMPPAPHQVKGGPPPPPPPPMMHTTETPDKKKAPEPSLRRIPAPVEKAPSKGD